MIIRKDNEQEIALLLSPGGPFAADTISSSVYAESQALKDFIMFAGREKFKTGVFRIRLGFEVFVRVGFRSSDLEFNFCGAKC
jgi:hypothetical protein